MDSWIWQPGYPLVTASLESTDDRPASCCPAAVPLRHDDSGRATRCGRSRSTVRNGGVTSTVLLDGPDAVGPIALADPTAPSSSTPAGTGSTGSRTTTSFAAASPATRWPTLTTLERYNLVDDAWAATSPAASAASSCCAFLDGVRRRARLRRLAGDRHRAARARPIARRRRRSRRVPGPAFAHWSRPALDELGDPTAGEQRSDGKLRGLLVGAVGRARRRRRARRPGAASCSTRRARDPSFGRSRSWPRPRRAVVAATGDADDLRADARRVPNGQHPAGAAPPPVRARRVRRRGADPANVRVRDERRGQDAERPVRASPGDRQPPPRRARRGHSSASTGTRPTSASRPTRSSAWPTA